MDVTTRVTRASDIELVQETRRSAYSQIETVELRSWSKTVQDTFFADDYQDDDDHNTDLNPYKKKVTQTQLSKV
jgi:hypothetical protein